MRAGRLSAGLLPSMPYAGESSWLAIEALGSQGEMKATSECPNPISERRPTPDDNVPYLKPSEFMRGRRPHLFSDSETVSTRT